MENSCLKLPFPGWEIVRELGRDGCETWYEIQNTEADGNAHRAMLRHLSLPLSEDEACAWKDQLPQDSRGTAIYCSPVETLAAELRQLCAWGTHPGIALPMDYAMIQQKDGLGWDVFICAPLLPSLEEYSARELSDEAQIVQMAVELCDALSACHQRGLLHRNIQPRSILCAEDGHFQLGNFGGVQGLEITKATSPYIAPEVHFGKPESVQSDIYTLGLVLYWLLNENRLPFLPLPPKPVQQNHMEAAEMRRMRGERLPSPAHGSPGLQAIVQKACEYESCKRYQNVTQMRQALEKLQKPDEGAEPVLRDVEALTAIKGQAFKTNPQETQEAIAMELRDSKSTQNSCTQEKQPTSPKPHNVHIQYWGIAAAVLAVATAFCVGVFFKSPKERQQELPSPASETIVQQTQPTSSTEKTVRKQPVLTLAAGRDHTVGLRADGTVVAVGENSYGRCDVGEWTNIVAVAAGYDHTVGVKSDGSVVATGWNIVGQCEVQLWEGIAAVSAGSGHTVGLKSDGTVVAAGMGSDGECDVEEWSDIVAVAAGDIHTVGLKSDGTVVAAGSNEDGQCNVEKWEDVVAVAAGGAHTVGLKSDGTVVAVGSNEDGQCNIEKWKDIVMVAAGDAHTVGLKSDGTVVAAGSSESGQCDVTEWKDIIAVVAGYYHTVGMNADGTVVGAGDSHDGQCDVGKWEDITAVAVGDYFTVGLKSDGGVIAIGRNNEGQCDVGQWEGIVAVDAGGAHTVGLKSDGTVLAAGYNEYGQCDVTDWGNISMIAAAPLWTAGLKYDGTAVATEWMGSVADGLQDIVAASVGKHYFVGLKEDGTVVAAGSNGNGQCNVGAWTDIVAVSAGAFHTVGVKSDGTVIAAGSNEDGQCNVEEWTDIVAIAAGDSYTVGVKSDGTVIATGQNNYGQCNVEEWKEIVAVAAGEFHTVGLKSDGTVVATGYNEAGPCKVSGWKLRLPAQ